MLRLLLLLLLLPPLLWLLPWLLMPSRLTLLSFTAATATGNDDTTESKYDLLTLMYRSAASSIECGDDGVDVADAAYMSP
jgi:hypothetical protein